MISNFIQCIASSRAQATALSSFTTASSILHPKDKFTFPANTLTVGAKIRIRVFGSISNTTGSPTFTFNVMMGSTIVFSTGAITVTSTANTNVPFELQIEMRLDSTGNGTNAKFVGHALFHSTAAASGSTALVLPTTAPAAGNGFDDTIANILDVYCACNTSNASNAVGVWDYTAEVLAPAA
jgi:hypothetical protein